MSLIDPNHPIICEPKSGRVQALFEGHLVADSDDVIVLREADLAPVYYFPRQDVEMAVLARSDFATSSPYKGEAAYFTIQRDAKIVENVAWSYERPHQGLHVLAGRIAFAPEHVEFHEVASRTPEERRVDAVVQHTDSGSGASQGERWPASVKTPEPEASDRIDKPYEGVGSI